jgi:hypothetical protein
VLSRRQAYLRERRKKMDHKVVLLDTPTWEIHPAQRMTDAGVLQRTALCHAGPASAALTCRMAPP